MNRHGIALALIRMVVGMTFVLHGAQKLFVYHYAGTVGAFAHMGIPAPTISAALAITAESMGGLFLLVGLHSRLAAIPIAFTMLVAIAQVHLHAGFFAQSGGFEYPLVLLVANLAFVVGGGGSFALDNLRRRGPEIVHYQPNRAKAA